MYGNIGVPQRLEFTVIGKAANEAARLEGMCKELGEPILISPAFPRCFPGEMKSLGTHSLRGVSEPQEVFALTD
jgi:adenylate cyclase